MKFTVVNYLLESNESRKIILDKIERKLCEDGISYVKVDNEIHFLDVMFRFIIPSEIILFSPLDNIRTDEQEILGNVKELCSGNYFNQDIKILPMENATCIEPTLKEYVIHNPIYIQPSNKKKQLKMQNKVLNKKFRK